MSNSSDTKKFSMGRALITRPLIRCSTMVKRIKCEYIWTISDYMSAFIDKEKTELKSSWFSATENTSKFQICLSHYKRDDTVKLHIATNKHNGATKNGLFEIEARCAIVNSEREESNILAKTFLLSSSISYDIGCLIKVSDLIKNKNMLLPQDKLTISCETIFTIEVVEDCPEESCVIPLEMGDSGLEGFEKLFNAEEFSDVTIHVNGKEYLAHKVVLAARSKVFAAMFQHEMTENQTARIDIKDIDDEIFEEVLRFMYTGKVENLETLAYELLPVADKYDLEKLKVMCGKALYEKLSVKTVVKILVLADMHNLEFLKNYAIRYIRKSSIDIIKNVDSESWTNLSSRSSLLKCVVLECLK